MLFRSVVGGLTYHMVGEVVDMELRVGRVGDRYTIVAQVTGQLTGPCQRCLSDAVIPIAAQAREVTLRGESEGEQDDEEAYVVGWSLDVERWARDMVGSSLPSKLLCSDDCPGLCPICGADLKTVGPDHHH